MKGVIIFLLGIIIGCVFAHMISPILDQCADWISSVVVPWFEGLFAK